MRQPPGTYTKFISILKVTLTLSAVALLGTIFLFTGDRELEGGLRFTPTELGALDSGMHISDPKFSGLNSQGDVYAFDADSVTPNIFSPGDMLIAGFRGEVQFSTGLTVYISSDDADFAVDSEILVLEGNVVISTSDGTTAKSAGMQANLADGVIFSDTPVTGTNEMGNISAGSFRIEQHEEEKQMIWFENGVKLRFRPSSWEQSEESTE